MLEIMVGHWPTNLSLIYRGALIIGLSDISATDMVIFIQVPI